MNTFRFLHIYAVKRSFKINKNNLSYTIFDRTITGSQIEGQSELLQLNGPPLLINLKLSAFWMEEININLEKNVNNKTHKDLVADKRLASSS